MGLAAGAASVVGDVCEFERYEVEFLRMPLGRSACELGECSWGECAVIFAEAVLAGVSRDGI